MTDRIFVDFPEIDTQYWQLSDPAWVKQRQSQWLSIEPMLLGTMNKSKKAITIIKRYFLKGIMPDFEKLKKWESDYRHLDLFSFLWLHPSWDEQVLTELRHAYVHYRLVLQDDVEIGFSEFISSATHRAEADYEPERGISNIAHSGGYNELLFKVLMGDLSIPYIPEYREKTRWRWQIARKKEGIQDLFYKTSWLCNKHRHQLAEDYLFQYDLPMQLWYEGSSKQQDFFTHKKFARKIPYLDKALYRIHHFDDKKEGDTARSRFVKLARKILDEGDFVAEFKQRWLDVKAGKIIVDDAW